jgi:hypothetical protein
LDTKASLHGGNQQMTKELLQQALNEAKANAIEVFTYEDGIAQSARDAIEHMHSWLGVYFEKQAIPQEPIEQPLERDGILEWTPSIGIECAISSLRDDAARLRDGGYTPLQIADDLDVIANDLAKCKPDAQPLAMSPKLVSGTSQRSCGTCKRTRDWNKNPCHNCSHSHPDNWEPKP